MIYKGGCHCGRIVFDLEDEDHGGRSYSCRDPEGHLWNFGTCDPWTDR